MPMSAGPDTRSITDSAQEAFELRRSHGAGFVRALVAAPSGLGGLAYSFMGIARGATFDSQGLLQGSSSCIWRGTSALQHFH